VTHALYVAEPVAAYARRPWLVVDASVVAAVLFAEPWRDEAEARFRGRRLCAPALIDFEIANIAVLKGRTKVLGRGEIERALAAYSRLDLRRESVGAPAMAKVAADFGLTAYDAAYLCVAEAVQAPLATFDSALGRAAERHLRGDGQRPGEDS
jgi:predicted nucleic acid-binding protein